MNANLQKHVILFVLLLFVFNSCRKDYIYYIARNEKGRKTVYRSPKSYERYHNTVDSTIIAKHYRQVAYPIDPSCISRKNSKFNCDSIQVNVAKDSKDYAPIFRRGIIPTKVLSENFHSFPITVTLDSAGNLNGIFDTSLRVIYISGVEKLSCYEAGPTKRMFKFEVYPYYDCYAELTNNHAMQKTRLRKFIKG